MIHRIGCKFYTVINILPACMELRRIIPEHRTVLSCAVVILWPSEIEDYGQTYGCLQWLLWCLILDY